MISKKKKLQSCIKDFAGEGLRKSLESGSVERVHLSIYHCAGEKVWPKGVVFHISRKAR